MSDVPIVESVVQRPEGAEPTEFGARRRDDGETDQARKRARLDTGDEEKKRGKRLFGSLLGALGGMKKEATSSKAQERAAKQAESELRQKERLQRAADELAEKQLVTEAKREAEEREALATFEAQHLQNRLAQKVLLASNLVTEASPPLYFMPWKLTQEQEARIDAQITIAKREQAESLRLFPNLAPGEPQAALEQDDLVTNAVPVGDETPPDPEPTSRASMTNGSGNDLDESGHQNSGDKSAILESAKEPQSTVEDVPSIMSGTAVKHDTHQQGAQSPVLDTLSNHGTVESEQPVSTATTDGQALATDTPSEDSQKSKEQAQTESQETVLPESSLPNEPNDNQISREQTSAHEPGSQTKSSTDSAVQA